MDKKKYDVTIAGVEMSILSDEREDFVQKLVSRLDTQITDITIQNKRCSKLDAAILVALDLSSEKAKSEKRVRNLEAQIALYDANLRRMREENIKLKSAMLSGKDAAKAALEAEEDAREAEGVEDAGLTQLSIDDSADDSADETADAESTGDTGRRESLKQIAELLGRKKEEAAANAVSEKAETAEAEKAADSEGSGEKEDKLRQIESLLRKNNI